MADFLAVALHSILLFCFLNDMLCKLMDWMDGSWMIWECYCSCLLTHFKLFINLNTRYVQRNIGPRSFFCTDRACRARFVQKDRGPIFLCTYQASKVNKLLWICTRVKVEVLINNKTTWVRVKSTGSKRYLSKMYKVSLKITWSTK